MGLLDLFSGSDSGGNTTTSSTVKPWSGVMPYLLGQNGVPGALPAAANLFQQGGPQYYPNSTVANFSPEQLQAMQLTAGRAVQGAPEVAAARGQLTDTLSGNYLNAGNPYTSKLADDIWSQVGPKVSAMYSAAGRSPGGNSLYADTATRAFTEALAPSMFQNYSDERTNQQRAAALSPTIANQDYTDLNALAGVGQQRQTQGQNQINDAFNRYMYNQNLPQLNLSNYLQNISGAGNYTTTTNKTPYYTNPAAGALGGAATGAGIGNSIMPGGTGAAGGALVGGLLGLF